MNVLVTGRAGYVRSIVTEELLRETHKVIILDNLQQGHKGAALPETELVLSDICDTQTVETVKKVTSVDIPVGIFPRCSGDPATLVASSGHVTGELGWKSKFLELEAIIESAWRWIRKHPNAYKN